MDLYATNAAQCITRSFGDQENLSLPMLVNAANVLAMPTNVTLIHKLNLKGKVSTPRENIKEGEFVLVVVIILLESIVNIVKKVFFVPWMSVSLIRDLVGNVDVLV